MMKVSLLSLLVFLSPCNAASYGLDLPSLLMGKRAGEGSTKSLFGTREGRNVDIETEEETGLLDTFNSAIYGLNILSLLMGNQAEERSPKSPELLHYDHHFKTRVAKNVDIQTEEEESDQLGETREAKNVESESGEGRGLLDTLNLSLAGNLDISNAVGQARDLSTSLASAIGAIIDLNLVRSIVDIAVDRLQENSRQGRAQEKKENIKTGITTVVGAALGEQECWERTACKLGEYGAEIPGKDIFFILADRLASSNWLSTLNIVKDSATWAKDCDLFQCSADPK